MSIVDIQNSQQEVEELFELGKPSVLWAMSSQ
jgi:hypothetical protein